MPDPILNLRIKMSFLDHHVLKAGQHEYTFIHSVYHWLFLFMFCLCLCLCFVFVCVLLGLICVWWTGWQKKFPPPLERGLSAALTTPCLVRTNLPLISTNCTNTNNYININLSAPGLFKAQLNISKINHWTIHTKIFIDGLGNKVCLIEVMYIQSWY